MSINSPFFGVWDGPESCSSRPSRIHKRVLCFAFRVRTWPSPTWMRTHDAVSHLDSDWFVVEAPLMWVPLFRVQNPCGTIAMFSRSFSFKKSQNFLLYCVYVSVCVWQEETETRTEMSGLFLPPTKGCSVRWDEDDAFLRLTFCASTTTTPTQL